MKYKVVVIESHDGRDELVGVAGETDYLETHPAANTIVYFRGYYGGWQRDSRGSKWGFPPHKLKIDKSHYIKTYCKLLGK